jgi:hypothetical protein
MQTIGVLLAVDLSCLMTTNMTKMKSELGAKTGWRLHSQEDYIKKNVALSDKLCATPQTEP